MATENVRLLMRALLLGLTLSSAAWGQSARPHLAEPPRELPRRLPYEQGQRIPDGYRLRTGMNEPLLITGIAVAGGGYAFGVMGAMDLGFEDNSGYLLIPLVGPWLTLAAGRDPQEPCDPKDVCQGGDISIREPAIAVDGVIQAIGTAFILGGLFSERRYLELKDVTLSVAPASFGRGRYGLGAVGTF